ncbi:MAG TPA: substrate-binding domain-containing protein [Vicinamibacterales bacterium]|jgi:mxaJ protein|nr:substrate-binding domain-containing protein [Vicinamibacterales bacterium]
MKGAMIAAAAAMAVTAIAGCHRAPAPPERVLRVCADPNNLPYSNRAGEGFENKIASLLAADRHERLEYTWWAQRRGYVRNTLKAGDCDVLVGVPTSFELALTTRPYYRSTYVFVARHDRHLHLSSLDDPRLHRMRIGVQMVGDDFNNTPPAHALSSRGIIRNVVGYEIYGDYSQPHPLSGIVEAVERGDVDAALAWGPPAAYFARMSRVPLDVTPVTPQIDLPFLPFVFDMSMGVRHGDNALRDELDDFLVRRQADIDAILGSYNVPRVDHDQESAS